MFYRFQVVEFEGEIPVQACLEKKIQFKRSRGKGGFLWKLFGWRKEGQFGKSVLHFSMSRKACPPFGGSKLGRPPLAAATHAIIFHG